MNVDNFGYLCDAFIVGFIFIMFSLNYIIQNGFVSV